MRATNVNEHQQAAADLRLALMALAEDVDDGQIQVAEPQELIEALWSAVKQLNRAFELPNVIQEVES
jgi:hypothetical protein